MNDNIFCAICKFQLNIEKLSTKKSIILNKPIDIINLNFISSYEYIINFSKKELLEYLNENKTINKNETITLFENINQKKSILKFIQKCTNCGYEYELKPKKVIYSLNFESSYNFNDENIDLLLNNPILPRTKDYKCPNEECKTNSQTFNPIEKEAVIYKGNNSYKPKYACTICKCNWLI